MRRYCSLADSKYLAKFLALHESLVRHSSEDLTVDFLALDNETFWLLNELKLKNVTVHQLESFETQMHMRPVRASRSLVEYYWTLASCYLEFLMSRTDYDEIAYLDADLFFFSDPKTVFDEIGERSIAIVPHRFSPENRHLERNGKFNVGWISFKRTSAGRKCLGQWASNCRAWCFHKNENGKFADQGYLNDFEKDYGSEVAVIQNIGVGVAPWNLQQYAVAEGPRVDGVFVNHFHYHEYQSETQLTNYKLRREDKEFIYAPYNLAIRRAQLAIDVAKVEITVRREQMRELPVG